MSTENAKKHRRDWFVNRYNREVPIANINFKNKGGYKFLITDEEHANYLYLLQDESGYRYEERKRSLTK